MLLLHKQPGPEGGRTERDDSTLSMSKDKTERTNHFCWKFKQLSQNQCKLNAFNSTWMDLFEASNCKCFFFHFSYWLGKQKHLLSISILRMINYVQIRKQKIHASKESLNNKLKEQHIDKQVLQFLRNLRKLSNYHNHEFYKLNCITKHCIRSLIYKELTVLQKYTKFTSLNFSFGYCYHFYASPK